MKGEKEMAICVLAHEGGKSFFFYLFIGFRPPPPPPRLLKMKDAGCVLYVADRVCVGGAANRKQGSVEDGLYVLCIQFLRHLIMWTDTNAAVCVCVCDVLGWVKSPHDLRVSSSLAFQEAPTESS